MRLIDILNKIANGELKEGAKVILGEHIYDVEIFSPITPLDKEFLNTEVELIEPKHLPDVGKMSECEHEWEMGGIRDTIDPLQVVAFQHCKKCGITKIMETKKQETHKEVEPEEPTDNTKIEELNVKGLCEIFEGKHTVNPNLAFSTALNKLNEVINKVNIHSTVLLAQEKDIKEIQEELDY